MKDYTVYVTEDIARKAMKKGFECTIITTAAFGEELHCYNEFQIDRTLYRCPTTEQICNWLIENGIYVWVEIDTQNNEIVFYPRFTVSKSKFKKITIKNTTVCLLPSKTYNAALIDCIMQVLDLI